MKKIFKSRIFLIILTAIICISVTAYATIKLQANEIGYKSETVEDALDNLYKKADIMSTSSLKLCEKKSGNSLTVGSKYECTLGDKDENDNYVKRNFYVLTVNDDNTIDLIMERNISGDTTTMSWNDAMNYFSSQDGIKYKNAWKSVIYISLPSATAIAKATNYSEWTTDGNQFCLGIKTVDSNDSPFCYSTDLHKSYSWLYSYLRGCSNNGCDENTSLESDKVYGYWTSDLVGSSSDTAWNNAAIGRISKNDKTLTQFFGVRPVIKVLKSSLYD